MARQTIHDLSGMQPGARSAETERKQQGCADCKRLRRRYVPVPAEQPHTMTCEQCGTCWAKKPPMLTLPQVREAMIGVLANCQGDIAYFQQVLGDGEPGEKRHARRMLAVLNELDCCDVAGKWLTHGLRVTFSDGSRWEFLVRQIDQMQ